MSSAMRSWLILAVGLVVGAAIVWLLPDTTPKSATSDERQPLYWVAPMDPNYRRDQPGKSPMGMDLVPVYDANNAGSDNPGAVRISPSVENNLGVRTELAQERTLAPTITTVGLVQYDQDQLEHIHPRVEGWIETLHVKSTGDPVKKGQKLYSLYSPELVNAQEELVWAVKQGGERIIAGAVERLRALQIPEQHIQSLKQSRQVSQTVTFFAPKSGVLDNLNVREGFFVEPGVQLMSIAVLDTVWVEAEVFASQAPNIEVGLPVTMTLDFEPGTQWRGQVDYVYPSLTSQTRTLRLRLRFANPNQVLKPGMYTLVAIKQAMPATLTVPRESVIRTGEQDRVVIALGDGRYKSVAVQLGRSDRQYFEVLRGLQIGDTVVTSAQFLLDSESSKTSDFARWQKPERAQSASVEGKINRINRDERTVNISRDAIKKWRRPPATLDFFIADNLDFSQFNAGEAIQFTFEIRDGAFIVTQAERLDHAGNMGGQP